MAISSIHIEPGNGGFFSHNSRESETKNSIFDDEENFCSSTKKESFEIYREELKIRSAAYTKRTNQKLQKNAITHLSAISNFNKDHSPEDIKKVCNYLEEKLDTKIIQYSMHRDEGHIIENESEDIHESINIDTAIKNYHGHIEMMGLDSQGNSIRRKLDKPFLKNLQTDVANILNMERGQESGYSKAEYDEIRSHLKPVTEYESKKEHNLEFNRVATELGYSKKRKKPTKRLGTYEYKSHAQKIGNLQNQISCVNKHKHNLKVENVILESDKEAIKSELAKQKDLKKEIGVLRVELKENSASRSDYAELEQLNKDLKLKIKNKDITGVELNNEITELKEKLIFVGEASKVLKRTNDILEDDLKLSMQKKVDSVQIIEKKDKTLSLIEEIITPEFEKTKAENPSIKGFKAIFQKMIFKFEEFRQKILNLQKENQLLKDELIEQKTIRTKESLSHTEHMEKLINEIKDVRAELAKIRMMRQQNNNSLKQEVNKGRQL